MLELYFEPCLRLFFPAAQAQIDWSRPYEFLDKELQQIARDAELGRRYADKLVRVWLLDGRDLWILIHVEVQGQRDDSFPERMYIYNTRIAERYGRPVASLAILCDTSPNWQPSEFVREVLGCRLEFRFLTAKLLGYKQRWAELEASSNPFATIAMAHLQAQATRRNERDRLQWKLRLIRRLYERGYEREDIIQLFHFIDWVMALPEELEQEVWEEIQAYEREQRMPYISSVERIGLAKGLEQGRQQEALRMLLRLMEGRFGPIPSSLQAQLQELTVVQLEELLDSVLTAASLEQLAESLAQRFSER